MEASRPAMTLVRRPPGYRPATDSRVKGPWGRVEGSLTEREGAGGAGTSSTTTCRWNGGGIELGGWREADMGRILQGATRDPKEHSKSSRRLETTRNRCRRHPDRDVSHNPGPPHGRERRLLPWPQRSWCTRGERRAVSPILSRRRHSASSGCVGRSKSRAPS